MLSATVENAKVEKIYFDDELMSSSKIIFATLQMLTGESRTVVMVRETRPTFMKEFDDFWNEAKKTGFNNLNGRNVVVTHYADVEDNEDVGFDVLSFFAI